MNKLPQAVIDARNVANSANDDLQLAWDELNNLESATIEDIEKWLAVREKFYLAQERFEKLLRQSLGY